MKRRSFNQTLGVSFLVVSFLGSFWDKLFFNNKYSIEFFKRKGIHIEIKNNDRIFHHYEITKSIKNDYERDVLQSFHRKNEIIICEDCFIWKGPLYQYQTYQACKIEAIKTASIIYERIKELYEIIQTPEHMDQLYEDMWLKLDENNPNKPHAYFDLEDRLRNSEIAILHKYV